MSPTSRTADALSVAITAAVETARAGDLDGFADACAAVNKQDAEQSRIVQASVIRSLLEDRHPDGLDADDIRELITGCSAASAWYPQFEEAALLPVLGGALGVTDPDEQPPLGQDRLVVHAALVIADLCAPRPTMLADHLAAAIAEIRRVETIEMP